MPQTMSCEHTHGLIFQNWLRVSYFPINQEITFICSYCLYSNILRKLAFLHRQHRSNMPVQGVMSCKPISPLICLQVSASPYKQLRFVIKFVIKMYCSFFIDEGMGAYSHGTIREIRTVAKLWCCTPKFTFRSRGFVGGEHPLSCIKSPSYMSLLYKFELDRMRAKPIHMATVFWQDFRWLLACSIGKNATVSYHTFDHIWSRPVAQTTPSHATVWNVSERETAMWHKLDVAQDRSTGLGRPYRWVSTTCIAYCSIQTTTSTCHHRRIVVTSNDRRWSIYGLVSLNTRRFLTHPRFDDLCHLSPTTPLMHKMVYIMSSFILVCLEFNYSNITICFL